MHKTIIAACLGMVAGCGIPTVPSAPLVTTPSAVVSPSPAALVGEGRYAEAIALLEEGTRRRPGAVQFGDLAYAYYLSGHPAEAVAALERACLAEPSNPEAWERLAALLEATGASGRALEAMRHARMLREAGPQQPTTGEKRGEANVELWPAGMARVEVRQISAGLVEVARVESSAPTRLEVSNGNGIRGMAAAVAQRLRAEGMQVVRLTNTVPFNVEETRVEVRGNGDPLLRIVLGRDAGIKKPPGISGRQAP